MDKQELLHKLAQIEEHASDGVREFPQLGKERFRMIRALARQLRSDWASEASEAGLRGNGDQEEAGG